MEGAPVPTNFLIRLISSPPAFALVAIALFVALGGSSSAAVRPSAVARPDLVVSAVSTQASSVPAGSTLGVADATKNRGRRKARASTTQFYLSADQIKDGSDVLLGARSVKSLKPRKSSKGTTNVTLPSFVSGAQYLLACADGLRKVRESRERNNCRVAPSTLTITPPEGSGGGGGPGGPVLNPPPDDDGDGSPNSADCAPQDPSIHPAAPDEPDLPDFRDTDCDGIDGKEADAVFVSTAGDDANPGTRAQPKRTIQAGVTLADNDDRQVYVSSGEFDGLLSVADGVGVYGGYSPADWSRSAASVTRVTGGFNTGALAVGVASPTTLQHLTLAPVAPTQAGASSYGLRASQSPGLVLDTMVIRAADGVAGSDGTDGADGAPGTVGQPGSPGSCNGAHGSGGGGGFTEGWPDLPSQPPPPAVQTGGNGGRGAAESGVDRFGSPDPQAAAQPGEDGRRIGEELTVVRGGDAGATPGGNADGGDGGDGEDGHAGVAGTNGAGGSGGGGIGAGGLYAGDGGNQGTDGTRGAGGGGGGGGGAQRGDDVDNGGGNGGGGGGGAGQGGRSGRGGQAGGGSFGVVLGINNVGVTIRNSTIVAGDGGSGGAGGTGGDGGFGLFGGEGGSECTDQIGRGGDGGQGGNGARGGHGGGGTGGPSIAVRRAFNSTVTLTDTTLTVGSGGSGGGGPGNSGDDGAATPQF